MTEKKALRVALRTRRAEYVASLSLAIGALLFRRPPAPLESMFDAAPMIAVYFPHGAEASPLGWARWLHERGHTVALPWFESRASAMTFRVWANPLSDDDLESDPWGSRQPLASAAEVVPDLAVVPLLGFTAEGARLGQGGGHFDRYLAAHPAVLAIGIGWDCQLCPSLALEHHDVPLSAVVTPTRIYGPFDA